MAKEFTGDVSKLPKPTPGALRGPKFDDDVIIYDANGGCQQIAAAGVPYSADFYNAVSKSLKKIEPKENKKVTPKETK